jgi:hypothetical protein
VSLRTPCSDSSSTDVTGRPAKKICLTQNSSRPSRLRMKVAARLTPFSAITLAVVCGSGVFGFFG